MANIAAPAPASATPWWVWSLGGVVAIAAGIGLALWYAGRADPAPVASTATHPAALAVAPAAPAAPKLVEVRFDSLPSAGVFADGHSAELCRTPCAFNVDLGDGGATDQRTFVVRVGGYQDKQVVVDLTAAHPEMHVTLERSADAAIEIEPPTPTPTPTPTPAQKKNHPGTRPARPVEAKPAEIKPSEPPSPPPKKPVDSIDQTETLDPFHSK
jgi:hypothetical protein